MTEMYENYIFEGGSYKHRKLVELIEDLGGYIITKRIFAQEAQITFAAPIEDYEHIVACVKEIQGSIRKAPLLGTEIAVVAPTVTRHHLPHPLCDIAEFLRRRGAQTNMIGLARGVGRRIAQLTKRERALIEEHDVAVVCLGNFRRCIEEKVKLFADLNVPVVVTGLPEIKDDLEGCIYVSGIGRYPHRFKRLTEIDLLRNVADAVERAVKAKKEELSMDPPLVPPFFVKNEIANQVEDLKYTVSPGPIVLKLNGVRVKLLFDLYAKDVYNVRVLDYKLGEISRIRRSQIRNYILVDLLPKSLLPRTMQTEAA